MNVSPQRTSTTPPHSQEKLPVGALLALTMTGFLCIVTETLPAGLLPQIGQGLGTSVSVTGQMVSAYALGSLSAALPLSIATQSWKRRSVLLTTIIGFLIFNSITAASSSFTVTLLARFFAGMTAGLGWSLIGGYARRMVRPAMQGRALALAMAGTPLALSLGVPMGTWLGDLAGWRITFASVSVLALLLAAYVLVKVPDYPGQRAGSRVGTLQALGQPGVKPILLVILSWMLGHNVLYTYISPFVSAADLAEQVDKVLFAFGASAMCGIWIISRVVDSHLRNAVLTCLTGFGGVALMFAVTPPAAPTVYTGAVVWGLTFGGAATLLQTALAKAAGPAADVAQSISVVVWNSAIGGGGVLGGMLLHAFGVGIIAWVIVALISVALVTAFASSIHAFPGPGSADASRSESSGV